MNTKNLKAYAPKARRQFIEAVTKRAAHYGIYADRTADVQFEGSAAIIEGRAFSKAEGNQCQRLAKRIEEKGFDLFVREIAYTWFNRFAAIRYMELHDYLEHGLRVLSRPNQSAGLEILNHAADVCELLSLNKNKIVGLKLDGNKEEELYREILLGQCHYLNKIMPFMFEAIDDATELLLPDNLTKTDSILHDLVTDVPEDDWQEIEVIGWLYQFYISERKDEVIGKVVKSEDIPAATQLFTPNWIVKYLVQNSVGRQWLATYSDSELKSKMEYYIEPAEQTPEVQEQLNAITPESLDPENIKILDPACGSGHILIEVYETLREIYLERGYRLREIPELILTKNIFGLDIDDRAAQLAGFALLMKAREDDRRIFSRIQDDHLSLNILSLQETSHLDFATLWRDLEIQDEKAHRVLEAIWSDFEMAKTFGSLIEISSDYEPPLKHLLEQLSNLEQEGSLLQKPAVNVLKPVVEQALFLAHRYDAVIANPPYMDRKNMIPAIKKFARLRFDQTSADLYAMFIERNRRLVSAEGYVSMITMDSWLYGEDYKDFRSSLIDSISLRSLIHLGPHAFPEIKGEVVQTAAFVICKHSNGFKGDFFRLVEEKDSDSKRIAFLLKKNRYISDVDSFRGFPRFIYAYHASEMQKKAFRDGTPLKEISEALTGLQTGDNEHFIREWYEVAVSEIKFNAENRSDAKLSNYRWFPYVKGSEFRKWYGNNTCIVDWRNDGDEIKHHSSSTVRNQDFYFRSGLAYNNISKNFCARFVESGFIFDQKNSMFFSGNDSDEKFCLGFLHSKVIKPFLEILSPKDFNPGSMKLLPVLGQTRDCGEHRKLIERLISIAKSDWDTSEISWSFKKHGLVTHLDGVNVLSDLYVLHEAVSAELVTEVSLLEKQNNQYFVENYRLQDEINCNVTIEQVTLRQNPIYRYKKLTRADASERYQSELLSELVSYVLGCMMGRYSLDREGLIYAQSGNNGFKELLAEDAYTTFPADNDGIIPLTAQEWFEDDATTRFREFVKVILGDENLSENLTFVAESLCLHAIKPKRSESSLDTIRRYLSTQFYKDHLKTYKKRPIYWLFSSGKEKAFECLVYLHRYNEGTLSRMRTEYVTPLMGKFDTCHGQLTAQIVDASPSQQRAIEKELKMLEKKQTELRTFDENLKHYADQRISIDLGDGVKFNYGKFGNLLAEVKAVTGAK